MSTQKKDWVDCLPYDDSVLNANTDYYGEKYYKEERLNVVRSKLLKELLDGYATVDSKKGTITFFDRETIEKNFNNYLLSLTKTLYEKACDGVLRGYELVFASKDYKDCWALFFMNGYGKTSFDFIEDSRYWASQTFRIGNIFDAHI